MTLIYRSGALAFIAVLSCLSSWTTVVSCQETHPQTVSSAPATVGQDDDGPKEIGKLIQDLFASIEDGKASYDSIRIVGQIGRLGPDGSPAVDVLIDLLAKPFLDCDEALRVCPNNTPNCLRESKTCPADAEMRKYDYLTLYAAMALKQIGVAALPKLSVALDDGSFDEERFNRRRMVAGIMGEIGPAAVPFLSDSLRTSDHTKKRLALGALHTILLKEPSSGEQLTSLVPYITSLFNGDFETIDQVIYVLGVIGPGAAEAVPALAKLLSYERVLGDRACPVGERVGYIFQSAAKDALIKIGTPEALRAVAQYKGHTNGSLTQIEMAEGTGLEPA
jgi:hypothetical protein